VATESTSFDAVFRIDPPVLKKSVLTSHQISRAFHFGSAIVAAVAFTSQHSLWVIASCVD
jgi:hypothetical protein